MTPSPQPGDRDERCRCGLPRSSPVHGNPFGAGHRYEPEAAALTDQPGAGGEADDVVSSDGHRWLCARFYRTSSERDLCTCPPAPSAGQDTGQLRDALRIHHPVMRSETGPFSGCRCGGVRLGQDVIAHVVGELLRALDDPEHTAGT